MASSTVVRKPISVRATAEQHRMLTEAAAQQHRSLNGFVLNAALNAALQPAPPTQTRVKRTPEEIRKIIEDARQAFREANLTNRDLLAELIAERRAEAAGE